MGPPKLGGKTPELVGNPEVVYRATEFGVRISPYRSLFFWGGVGGVSWGLGVHLFLAISFCLLTFSSSNSRMLRTPISRQNSSKTSSSTFNLGVGAWGGDQPYIPLKGKKGGGGGP